MRIRTTKYIIKEGIVNTYRNMLMSLASLGIVAATMIVFGIFLIAIINVNYNVGVLKEQPRMKVYSFVDLQEYKIGQLEQTIKSNPKIKGYKKITKEMAYEDFKKKLGNDDVGLLEGLDAQSALPVSFVIVLKNTKDHMAVAQEFMNMKEYVEKVENPQKIIDFISKLSYWVQFISGFLLIIMLIISLMIIVNTVKLTVFARRREINIMKYIGATDWFIRWPFVIEGAIIGVLGSVLAFIITGIVYTSLHNSLRSELFSADIRFGFVGFDGIGPEIFVIFVLMGMVIGFLGSVFSIRKYLHV